MSSTPDSQAVQSPPPTLKSIVGRLAHLLEHGCSPGDLAALRRLDPADPSAPAFFKVTASVLADALPDGDEPRMEAERRWAAVLCAMATANGLHRPGRPLGSALAEAGFAELRLTRLLRARGDQMFPAVRAAAQFLAAKVEPFDATDLVRLVLSESRADEEKARRDVARSYFGTQPKNP